MVARLAGVLVVDKPSGPTSFEVVAKVKRAAGVKKAGHAGTLDPAATGVLVVCLGEAVRLQQFLTDGDKAYLATIAFGASTDTQDLEGQVLETGDPSSLTEEGVRAGLKAFLGEIDQVPPMYSAVRVSGKRLYESARKGEEVLRKPRKVMVSSLELKDLEPKGGALRRAEVEVLCGKGTYVRTLAADLGTALGVPAHLVALRRTRSSGFTLSEATPLEEIVSLASAGGSLALLSRLVPLARSLPGMREVRLELSEAVALSQGQRVEVDPQLGGKVCALHPDGRLVAVCEAASGGLRPVRVFYSKAELMGPPGELNH